MEEPGEGLLAAQAPVTASDGVAGVRAISFMARR